MILRVTHPLSAFCTLATLCLFMGCDGDTAREAASGATRATVEAVKGTAAGVAEGAKEGRQAHVGPDGVMILTTHEQLADRVNLTIRSVAPAGESGTAVELAFENTGDQPVRLIDLEEKHAMLLLDAEGFIVERSGDQPDEVTIPPHAKVRETFRFAGDAATARTLRLWGEDYSLPAAE